MSEAAHIPVTGGGVVSALWDRVEGADWTFIYAPGAGSGLNDGFGAFAARELLAHGIACLRFQFPYAEKGRRVPDRPALLEATWTAAIEVAREDGRRLVVGGRSMGGRIASQVVARGAPVDALVLFAYPLHAPGRPDRWRDAHLASIRVPTLFCSGTNDAFASPVELQAAASQVPGAAIHLMAGADHSFKAPKRLRPSQEDIWQEAVTTLIEWLPTPGHESPRR